MSGGCLSQHVCDGLWGDPVVTTLNGSGTDHHARPSEQPACGQPLHGDVTALQVSDSDAVDPPDHVAADYVFSFSTLVDSAPTVNQAGIVLWQPAVDPIRPH